MKNTATLFTIFKNIYCKRYYGKLYLPGKRIKNNIVFKPFMRPADNNLFFTLTKERSLFSIKTLMMLICPIFRSSGLTGAWLQDWTLK